MSDSDNERSQSNYLRKVLDDGRRYTQELLDKNNELRALVAKQQAQQQRLEQELQAERGRHDEARYLRTKLQAAEQEADGLRRELVEARAAIQAHAHEQEQLQLLLSQVDGENKRYLEEFAHLQQQANNLANLYVALDQLHATVDRAQVTGAMREILANLVGSEEVAFFEVDLERQELVLIGSSGIDAGRFRRLPLDHGAIGAAVRAGAPLVVDCRGARGPGEEDLTAVIPLRLAGQVNGAVAVFRLLPQKTGIGDLDRELFDVLAAHAGMALHTADLHARFAAARFPATSREAGA